MAVARRVRVLKVGRRRVLLLLRVAIRAGRVAARAERARVNALGRAGSADAEQYARETREEALAWAKENADPEGCAG